MNILSYLQSLVEIDKQYYVYYYQLVNHPLLKVEREKLYPGWLDLVHLKLTRVLPMIADGCIQGNSIHIDEKQYVSFGIKTNTEEYILLDEVLLIKIQMKIPLDLKKR